LTFSKHSFIHSRIYIAPLQGTTQRSSRLQHNQKEQFSIDYRMCQKVSEGGSAMQERGSTTQEGGEIKCVCSRIISTLDFIRY